METQNQIIEDIVNVVSQEPQIVKVFFFDGPLLRGVPYEVSLIIFEDCIPNYMISQGHYANLLKNVGSDVVLNILPVNCFDARRSLEKRLEDTLCIYDKSLKK